MQKFSERFKYYLIGFTFGVIAVFFFFGERGCSWLPGNRVKNTIAEKSIVYGDSIKALLECSKYTNDDIYNLLNSSGDIDFSESETRVVPKKYVFYGDNDLRVVFALHEKDEYSEIIEINAKCKISASNTHKQILPLPKNIIASIIESNEYTYYPEAQCEMECYGISKADVKEFHKTATIDMEKSRPWVRTEIKNNNPTMANKLYYLIGSINNTPYSIMYEIGENRTRIKRVIGEKDCGCR